MVKLIKDYVKEGNYLLVDEKTTVEEAVKKYVEKKLGGVLVTKGKEVIGIFTEKDLSEKVIAAGKDAKKLAISEVMTKNPVFIASNTDVDSCMFMMMRNKFRHLPVKDNQGNVYSVASVMDVLKAKLEDVTELEQSANIYEQTRLIDRSEDTISKITKQYESK